MQSDIDCLFEWSKAWHMTFNIDKCNILSITRSRNFQKPTYNLGHSILQNIDNFKYLGVTISSDLSWHAHINNITNRSTKILNFVKRNLYFCSSSFKSLAYSSLVRPHLEYSSAVWDPHLKLHVDALEKVQRRSARFVKNNYSWSSSVSAMINDLGWCPLQTRRKISRCVEFHKVVYNTSPAFVNRLQFQQARTRRTCNDLSFCQLPVNTNQYKFSFLPRTIVDWNSLPTDVRAVKESDKFSITLASHLRAGHQPIR